VSLERKDRFEITKLEDEDLAGPILRWVSRGRSEAENPTVCQFCASPPAYRLRLIRVLNLGGRGVTRESAEDFHFCAECAMNAGLALLDQVDKGT
jgi:hypothetical protein